jgi:hypothetical protein
LNEGISQESIEKVLDEIREVAITRTSNRSILGTMNELGKFIEWIVYDDGLLNADISKLNMKINRMPCGAMDYKFCIDALKEALT